MSRAYKRSWKNLLLDTEYQLVFTLFLVASCALFMTGLGYLVMHEAHKATTIAVQDVQGQALDSEAAQNMIAHLMGRQTLLTWILVGVGVALCLGLFVYGIKMTHHVAGPLFKVSLYLDKVANGKFDKVYNLRKGDQLRDFYENFKHTHEALRKTQERDIECLRAVITAAEKGDVASKSKEVAERLEELRTLLKTKEATLG